MKKRRKIRHSSQTYIDGILKRERVLLSQAITLVESNLPEDQEKANEILEAVLPYTNNSLRVGITGVPGVGKSTFIEALGKHIISQNKKLAVLAVDPSSNRSRGSILGDKTRMPELSNDPMAYIRPSPTQSSLGGVARRTREVMLLCEAAGYEVIIIETVGVGQSETLVHGMVDFFLLLMLAGAGDELQGIKKGIMEMADAVVINKADGDNLHRAKVARKEYESALHLFPPAENGWYASVMTCSAIEKTGIAKVWDLVLQYQQEMQDKGFFEKQRQAQQLHWMLDTIRQNLEADFFRHPKVLEALPKLKEKVAQGIIPPQSGANSLINLYKQS